MIEYPKIAKLQTCHRRFADKWVEVSEKVDGSQFSFMLQDGVLHTYARAQEITAESPNKLFDAAMTTMLDCVGHMKAGVIYRCEYLSKPHHSCLAYDGIPLGNLVLFDVQYPDTAAPDGYVYGTTMDVATEAQTLGIASVPILFQGIFPGIEQLHVLINSRMSFLGGQLIEGVVVKDYCQAEMVGAVLFAKLVRPEFIEDNGGSGVRKFRIDPNKDFIDELGRKYRSTARWMKAIQHLRDHGQLQGEMKDVGLLVREVQSDLETECAADIKELLYKQFSKRVKKNVVEGLAEFYLNVLAAE